VADDVDDVLDEDEGDDAAPLVLAGAVGPPTIAALPGGYVFGVTRYADVILERAYPDHLADLCHALEHFDAQLSELQVGGGNRTPFVERFDSSLEARGWGKRAIKIGKTIDDEVISEPRGHEIDMFKARSADQPYPGIAVEMEWSNKDPFFDRDLLNFEALHREGALAVGVLVTRGPTLQRVIKPTIRSESGEKYGESTTHWRKLVGRVNLGGGGECPLLLVGIEPPRIGGFAPAQAAYDALREAAAALANWRDEFDSYAEARTAFAARKAAALAGLSATPAKKAASKKLAGVKKAAKKAT
jgi:hypothetical protein